MAALSSHVVSTARFLLRSARRLRSISMAALLALAPAPGRGAAPDSTVSGPLELHENAFPVALGAFSTTLAGSGGPRTHNIRLSCEALDGVVLAPGDVLSFNRVVGKRTPERGYQVAPVILRAERQLQLGGGICQTASTIFVAGLLSGLGVVQRHKHTNPVDYVPLGQDATVSWGAKDLAIRNDLGQRIRLRVSVLGSTLTARFEGEAPLDEEFELALDVRESADAHAGAPGREIELHRVRRVAGEERDRELVHRDVYPIARVREHEGGR